MNRFTRYLILSLCVLCLVVIASVIYHIRRFNTKQFVQELITKNTDIAFSNDTRARTSKLMIYVHRPRMFRRIVNAGELGLAESYMDGDWSTNDLKGVMEELIRRQNSLEQAVRQHSLQLIIAKGVSYVQSFSPKNTLESSKTNIAHHYDVGNDLYTRMLGPTMQYTCAYYHQPNMTLDEAQKAKMQLIAKKLDLRPGMTVLDIGCGFGAMGYLLATHYGAHVVGVTLSREQVAFAHQYYRHPHLEVRYQDYRHVTGTFDRVYSIGMFEHVGRQNYAEYYDKCYRLLKQNGIMLLHTIGTSCRHQPPLDNTRFLGKYIFPQSQLPHISSLTAEFADRWHLEDWQSFGLSYAKTLRAWRKNIGDWSGIDSKRYDARFRRMWDFYLMGCAANFEQRVISLWQIVYTKRDSTRVDDAHHIRRNDKSHMI